MTNREAIEFLTEFETDKPILEMIYTDKHSEALAMAIQALKDSDDLYFEIQGIMHFVDKWLTEEEKVGKDNVQRADYAREKVLKIIEGQTNCGTKVGWSVGE